MMGGGAGALERQNYLPTHCPSSKSIVTTISFVAFITFIVTQKSYFMVIGLRGVKSKCI